MAQTKRKRRRKRRGTQGGSIDTGRRAAARPRSRAEAQARARAKRQPSQRADLPPTWRGAALRGALAAVVFGLLLIVIFKRPPLVALALGAFMLAFYIPAGYFIDMTLWRRRERARIRQRAE